MSKLKNIQAVTEMVNGNHRLQNRKSHAINLESTPNIIRNVGDIWEETLANGDVIQWEQKKGFRVKTRKNLSKTVNDLREYLSSFPNCQKETCTCRNPTTLDNKFRRLMGMCHDCVVSYETALKIKGEFNEYALNKMKRNAEEFFKQADQEVEVIIRALDSPGYTNGDGSFEKWEVDNKEGIVEKIKNEYNEFKQKTLTKFTTT